MAGPVIVNEAADRFVVTERDPVELVGEIVKLSTVGFVMRVDRESGDPWVIAKFDPGRATVRGPNVKLDALPSPVTDPVILPSGANVTDVVIDAPN